ncbi:FAD dependent oxidoreductase TIGR03364 [Salegentibacter echinorum]|uniref:FAD dependent oxidoreductase TIGR03364 n=1 Tax=Salegentibacter echinorum TaxID=1073325 RepID=A0A1M5FP18_SALEC|nr:TIGR03364 family FAD-dependent oxidoreductase [Salegentibacter echinorum]SHF93243.1 FAD dependent oxidoreductase TIGR03364 [Salegentibacter echinorum]
MVKQYDLIVVGGGILGTFHAYHALQNGLSVALLERSSIPQGATVRNFGQVVPSGMDAKWQVYGRRSLEIYKDIQTKNDISVRQQGTVYLASNQEELQLLEELHQINKDNNYSSQMLSKQMCLDKYPGLQAEYVKAGLFFPEEVNVEPHSLIQKLHQYMHSQVNLDIFYNCNVLHCESDRGGVIVNTANEGEFWATKTIICNGNDFKTLFPKLFETSDLEVCKLQMMQTVPQNNFKIPGSLLTGWTIRRYESFRECPSYAVIKAKENLDSFQNKWGIHILFKQAIDGSVIIGDSHQYASVKEIDTLGFDLNMELDDFMINEARKIFNLPDYTIANRWYGVYSQCKEKDIFNESIGKNIHIVTGIGGKGMTGSAGFAEKNIEILFK